MTYERLDQSLLPPLGGGDWLTATQIRERCDDPWAAPLIEDWLLDAFARGLLHVRRSPSRMDATEYRLTRSGRKAAERLAS